MNFAENLKRLRKHAQLSQEQLALACGFNGQSRISNYEASPDKEYAREPKLEEIPIIARALGAEIGELFGEPASGAVVKDARLDPRLISVTYRTLQNLADAKGREYSITNDPARFVQMYALCSAMPAWASMQELEKFGALLVDVSSDAATDERSRDGVQADGTRKKKVARRVRDKT